MTTHLLIELLESFSNQELIKLGKIVRCDYFNTDKYVIGLLDVLAKKIIRKKEFDYAAQLMVYQIVFNNTTIETQKLNTKQKALLHAKMSTLTRLAEKFMINESLDLMNTNESNLLFEALLKKNQMRLFEQHLKKRVKLLKGKIQEVDYSEKMLNIEMNRLNFYLKNGSLMIKDNLIDINCNLDLYYIINKLSIYITQLSLSQASPLKVYNYESIEAIEVLLNIPKYSKNHTVKLYRAHINLIKKNSYSSYKKFLAILKELKIPKDELVGSYVIATNFCAQQIKRGNNIYYKHLFNLYKLMDENEILTQENSIELGKLKNMITMGCKVGNYSWADKMIRKYALYIKKEIREAVCNYNFGVIEFYKSNYNLAIDYLYNLESINRDYDVNRKLMICKSYYEMETEFKYTTERIFRSFEKYISENKTLTASNKMAYRNFIRLLINLYRIKHQVTKMRLETVSKKLEGQKLNSDKIWLLEKLQELY